MKKLLGLSAVLVASALWAGPAFADHQTGSGLENVAPAPPHRSRHLGADRGDHRARRRHRPPARDADAPDAPRIARTAGPAGGPQAGGRRRRREGQGRVRRRTGPKPGPEPAAEPRALTSRSARRRRQAGDNPACFVLVRARIRPRRADGARCRVDLLLNTSEIAKLLVAAASVCAELSALPQAALRCHPAAGARPPQRGGARTRWRARATVIGTCKICSTSSPICAPRTHPATTSGK